MAHTCSASEPKIKLAGFPTGGHILYTSGTIGSNKKLLLRDDFNDRRSAERAALQGWSSTTVLNMLDFGLWTSMGYKYPQAVWYMGGCVVFDSSLDKFRNYFCGGVNAAYLTPPGLTHLVQAQEGRLVRRQDCDISIGGGFLVASLAEAASRLVTGRILCNYGSTETATAVLQSCYTKGADHAWMAPIGGRVVQVVDESGQVCGVGQEGRIRVQLTKIDSHSYLDDDSATARAFRDGFFYPGDMGVRRADGCIRILGRT